MRTPCITAANTALIILSVNKYRYGWFSSGIKPYLYFIKTNSMCCDNTNYKKEEINGECPACGEPTVNGDAYDQCAYGKKQCEVCGNAPCDESC